MRLVPLAIILVAFINTTIVAQQHAPNFKIYVSDDPAAETLKKRYIIMDDASRQRSEPAPESLQVIVGFEMPSSMGGRQSFEVLQQHEKFLNDLKKIQAATAARHSSPTSILFEYKNVFNGFALRTTPAIVEGIKTLSYVRSVTEDKKVRILDTEGNAIINAPQVWNELGLTGAGVKIGIIDTGVDYTHPDLGGGLGSGFKVIGGYDFINNDNDPMDDNGHGTHVAGIAASSGSSFKGVAPDASVYALKALDANGNGNDSHVLAAIERAVDPDGNPETDDALHIVNMSLGRYADPDEPLSAAVNNAVAMGITFVVAAGNSYDYFTIGTPGIARDAITVGATDENNVTADFSSRGPVENTFQSKPDVAAPGVSILSTWLNHEYRAENGTSMASPHVAGAAALILQKFPDWTPSMVKAALMGTSTKLQPSLFEQGAGVINAYKALATGFLMEPGEISLGKIDSEGPIISRTKTLTIHNTSNVSRAFTMSTDQVSSGAIILTFNNSSFSVGANERKDIELTVQINTNLLESLNLPGAHSASIICASDDKVVRSTITIINPQTTAVHFEGELPQSLIVIGIEGSYYWKSFTPSVDGLNLYLPNAKYDFIAMYANNRTVIKEGIITKQNLSVTFDKAMAKNLILFKPLDKDGNAIPMASIRAGSMIFSGIERNIFTFYPGPIDSLFISDQYHYRYDLEAHGLLDQGNNGFYTVQISTPNEISTSEVYSNDPNAFKEIILHNPSAPDGQHQLTQYVQTGNPWIYSTSSDAVPFQVPNPLKIFQSETLPGSNIMATYTVFSPSEGKSGYVWETSHWKSESGSLTFRNSAGEKFDSVTSDFEYRMGNALLRSNLYTNNSINAINLTIFPTTAAFNRTYGEREKGTISFTLKNGSTLLHEGTFSNPLQSDFHSGPVFVKEVIPDAYQISASYSDYQVAGKFGTATATMEFDLRKMDKDPPLIKYLTLDVNDLATSKLSVTDEATIKFRINDNCQNNTVFGYCYSSGLQSVTLKIRKADAAWQTLNINELNGLYTGEILSGLAEGYYDLQITATDNDDNKLTYELQPAFFVGENPVTQTPYAVVALLEPLNNDINAGPKPLFRWSKFPNATGYILQVSKQNNFQELVVDIETPANEYQLSNALEDDITYYWRVKATFNDMAIPFSATFSFFSGKLTPATLIAPGDGADGLPLSVLLNWSLPQNVFGSQLEVSLTPDFSSLVYTGYYLTDTARIHFLQPGMDYYWRVGCYYHTWHRSYYIMSEPFTFRTVDPPPAARLLTPPNHAANQAISLTLEWSEVADKAWQKLEVSTQENFNTLFFDSYVVGNSIVINNLQPSTDYYWRVGTQVTNNVGSFYLLSEAYHFKTKDLITSVENGENDLVKAYPNPFTHQINIDFYAPSAGNYTMAIHDLLGRRIVTLQKAMQAGNSNFQWSGLNNEDMPCAEGFYFGRIYSGDTQLHAFRIMLER